MFVNEKLYLVLSNLTEKPYELVLKDSWRDRVANVQGHRFSVDPGKIIFLIKE